MKKLKLTNFRIKIVWKIIPLRGIFGNMCFMLAFWTFGPSVEGFQHCRPMMALS